MVARRQLLALGFSSRAIARRLGNGRLHRLHNGVYAVGRPTVGRHGRWTAAGLACGPEAWLSHGSAAALWRVEAEGVIVEVSVISPRAPRVPGVRVHRRSAGAPAERSFERRIPVTGPVQTLIDLATRLDRRRLEAAVNAADRRDLVDPESLRAALADHGGRPGVRVLRELLDRRTFVLTDSELERHFLPIARRAGLPRPVTGRVVSGFKVNFLWPELGLVVETDGLRYHRTPAQQARDRLRDQAHTAGGLTALRFTDAQVRFEPRYVAELLARVARRLTSAR